jgi:signal transduction histidine kinase
MAEAGAHPPDALPPERVSELRKGRERSSLAGTLVAVKLDPDSPASAYLVVQWSMLGSWRLGPTLLAVMLALGLMCLPLARSIVHPLEKLTRAAESYAGGELSVRTGLRRKDEVGVLARTLDDMASRLAHRIRAEKELLANISHEIHTPLARIRMALELCARDDISIEKIRSHHAGIGGDLAELERLVDDVMTTVRLDLASEGSGEGLVLHREPVSLASIVGEAAVRFEEAHGDHDLHMSLPHDLPELQADAVLVRRVIDNLLDNAAKYSEAGTPLELGVADETKLVSVTLSDRGFGVDEADLPLLFEPFFRTAQARAGKTRGTGLGLTLCKRIVEAHGGEIEARRREGGGMTIRFTLPR